MSYLPQGYEFTLGPPNKTMYKPTLEGVSSAVFCSTAHEHNANLLFSSIFSLLSKDLSLQNVLFYESVA